ncbi:hypothetical protein MJO28_008331 [Puccinia striiformis f. sp. tritici]|uniref:Uncharacterized protein n=1 Tax=Puccinia striiformis f. sp. tritici TaxID=168172 RepID=A0ACC0EDK0_9BASI|nr:hypothetical protein MJO28_008331 [Puccinia striiformis f. sp. tritici]KAI7952610.1 hypothetical protein MJO29_008241 [Puccinia striiformis f. sp. tritici]
MQIFEREPRRYQLKQSGLIKLLTRRSSNHKILSRIHRQKQNLFHRNSVPWKSREIDGKNKRRTGVANHTGRAVSHVTEQELQDSFACVGTIVCTNRTISTRQFWAYNPSQPIRSHLAARKVDKSNQHLSTVMKVIASIWIAVTRLVIRSKAAIDLELRHEYPDFYLENWNPEENR